MSLLPSASLHTYSVLLSAVAGYVDAAGFASLIGLFPAHLTGELVGDAIAFSSGHPRDHRTHLWMLPVFVGSVVVASLTARILRRNGLRPLAGLLALVTVALALFSVSDELAQLLHVALRTRMLVGGGCAVAAMGVQNALMRESLKTSCPTTVMTGNLTQVVIDLADRAFAKLLPPSKYDRRPRSRLGPVSAALGAFLICALLGAWLTRMCGSSSVAVPTLMTALMTVWAWREDRVRAAQAAPVAAFASARVPSFEPAQVWPDSLMPASEPVSVSQVRAAPGVPPLPEAQNSSSRLIAEKRTVSGTRLAQRLRDDK